MKGKGLTYVLITSVAIVWGVIFYRVYNSINEEEAIEIKMPVKKEAYFKLVNHASDRVVLDLNYRNPFSGASNIIEAAVAEKPVANNNPGFIAAKPKPIWPAVAYTGFINNASAKQKLAMLSINSNGFTLKVGESANGIKLLKIAGDSVQIKFGNETKYIDINK